MDADTSQDSASALTSAMPADLSKFNLAEAIKSPHNKRCYEENQKLKKLITELGDYQIAHPKNPRATSREELDSEKKVEIEIAKRQKYIRSQLSLVKTLYRQSVMKVREEKAKTADARAVNDGLILDLHNLKYEEQSLRSEISAAENFDHKYTKLPLIPVEEFLDLFPEHKDDSDHDLMTARIEHERAVRVELEERRQEKLKQKQKLIAEVKKGKDDLTKLDGMVEKFIEAAEPIKKVLAHEWDHESMEPNNAPGDEPSASSMPGKKRKNRSKNKKRADSETTASANNSGEAPMLKVTARGHEVNEVEVNVSVPSAATLLVKLEEMVDHCGPYVVAEIGGICEGAKEQQREVGRQFIRSLMHYMAERFPNPKASLST